MAIATRQQLKLRLGVPSSDTGEDDALDALLSQCQALAEASIGQPIEQETRDFYLPGTGRQMLVLPRRPIAFVQPTATVTSGSTAVSGLSSTSLLVAGMPVVNPDYVPDGTTLASVNLGAGTAVLSQAATASGSGVRLSCGCAAWLDEGAEAGQQEGDFAASTALVPGTDFSVRPSSAGMAPAGLFWAGMLRRVAGVWPRHAGRTPGWLAPSVPGPLSADIVVKVRATVGWPASLVPQDLVLAVLDVCAMACRDGASGGVLSSQSFDGYSYSRDSGRLMDAWHGWLAGPGGAILAKYRRLVF